MVDLAVWKKTPNLHPPNFCLAYQARVLSSIAWRCHCFVTFKRLIAFLLSRTNFATSTSLSILTRMSSLNDGCGWCIIVNPPNLTRHMPNFAFPPMFSPANISRYTVHILIYTYWNWEWRKLVKWEVIT